MKRLDIHITSNKGRERFEFAMEKALKTARNLSETDPIEMFVISNFNGVRNIKTIKSPSSRVIAAFEKAYAELKS